MTDGFKVVVGLYRGSVLSPFFFPMMDGLRDEVPKESLWTIMFADGIVICSESKEQVEQGDWCYSEDARRRDSEGEEV